MSAPLDFRPLAETSPSSGKPVFRQGRSDAAGSTLATTIGLLVLLFAGFTFIVLALDRGKPLGVLIGVGCFVGAYAVIRWSNRVYASLGEMVVPLCPPNRSA